MSITVADSPKCVAFHFREKQQIINYAFSNYDFKKAKAYVIHLADKAAKTKTQQRIKKELEACFSDRAILNVINRVITNGEKTEFINYD